MQVAAFYQMHLCNIEDFCLRNEFCKAIICHPSTYSFRFVDVCVMSVWMCPLPLCVF